MAKFKISAVLIVLFFSFASQANVYLFSWSSGSKKMGENCHFLHWLTSSSSSTTTSKESCKHKFILIQNEAERAERFVAANWEMMKEEISRGGGQIMSDYSEVVGCSAHSGSMLSRQLRKTSHVFDLKSEQFMEIMKETANAINENEQLRATCAVGA